MMMQGPLWAQIALFFAIAVPAVGALTLLLCRLFSAKRGAEPFPEPPGQPGYRDREEFVQDLECGVPIDDVLSRARMGTPTQDRSPGLPRGDRKKDGGNV